MEAQPLETVKKVGIKSSRGFVKEDVILAPKGLRNRSGI